MVEATGLVPLLPLLGAAALLLFGRQLRSVAGIVATSTVGSSFLISLGLWGDLLQKRTEERVSVRVAYQWVTAGDLRLPVEFRIDPLTIVMLLVVTGVGALIHAYSIGYMASDVRRSTFFAYLNLFVFSMLILVMANNFLIMYVGWELVGVCSYLLISFWHFKPSAAAAGKKAFIVTRIGDLGLLVGILLIYSHFGTLGFDEVFDQAAAKPLAGTLRTAVPLLLFVGAVGKSAQFPLHVWLPDAMEGPTPVSALIHAATMVTAGVFLVARTHVLFEASGVAASTVAVIGAGTALFAATIAMAQDDIKRVLAYSTISQLGYMFLALGVGAATKSHLAYAAGIFHLVTHAFFKALLFLGSGSVMHATADTTDMKQMGGLHKALPLTSSTFIVGWLAIAGIPPLSGFFSKDAILAVAWESGLIWLWLVGVLTAGITAFYMSRQVFLTFFGRSRLSAGIHPHEPPSSMTIPLMMLAALAAFGGLAGLTLENGAITRFLRPVFGEPAHVGSPPPFHLPPLILAVIAVAAGTAGIYSAFRLYLSPGFEGRRAAIKERLGGLVPLVRNKFYIDELYGWALVSPGRAAANALSDSFDTRVIDGAVNGIGAVVLATAAGVRRIQSGLVRRYVMAMLAGAVAVVALFLLSLR